MHLPSLFVPVVFAIFIILPQLMYVEARQASGLTEGQANSPTGWPVQQQARARTMNEMLPLSASKLVQDQCWTAGMTGNNQIYASRPQPFPEAVFWRGRREQSPIPSELGAGKQGFMLVSEATGRRWHVLSSVRVCQFGEVRVNFCGLVVWQMAYPKSSIRARCSCGVDERQQYRVLALYFCR